MERFKLLDEILQADQRQLAWSILNHETGVVRPRELRDHYSAVARIEMHPDVPQEIRDHFQTTRHLCVYSWYVYSFMVVAELHAFATLELALRTRAPQDSLGDGEQPGLRKLIRMAIAQDWLTDDDLGAWNPRAAPTAPAGKGKRRGDRHAYLRILSDTIPEIRNSLAHGAHMLWPTRYHSLGIVAVIANAIFNQPVDVAVT